MLHLELLAALLLLELRDSRPQLVLRHAGDAHRWWKAGNDIRELGFKISEITRKRSRVQQRFDRRAPLWAVSF